VLQRDGVVSGEKVAIVERAMAKLSVPGLDPAAVDVAEKLLTDYAPMLGPADLRRYATLGDQCSRSGRPRTGR
jgi:hypothetical protein